jgi:hypothetical protein
VTLLSDCLNEASPPSYYSITSQCPSRARTLRAQPSVPSPRGSTPIALLRCGNSSASSSIVLQHRPSSPPVAQKWSPTLSTLTKGQSQVLLRHARQTNTPLCRTRPCSCLLNHAVSPKLPLVLASFQSHIPTRAVYPHPCLPPIRRKVLRQVPHRPVVQMVHILVKGILLPECEAPRLDHAYRP